MELLLYGLGDAGQPLFAERLEPLPRDALRKLAAERLSRCRTVEVWEGPTCVLRLRKAATVG